MKQRDPFLNWLLILLTLGQYMFVWVFLLARDANRLAESEYIQVRKHMRIFSVVWSIYFLGLVAIALVRLGVLPAAPVYLMPIIALLAFASVGYFIWLLLSVAEVLRHEGVPGIPSDGALIFYCFLYMAALPLLQSRLNKAPNQTAQTTPGLRPSVSDL
jgi:hypothetical protein